MNGIVRMIVRVFLIRGVYALINKGSTWWANRQAKNQSKEQAAVTREQGRKTSKNARRLVDIMRRFSRF